MKNLVKKLILIATLTLGVNYIYAGGGHSHIASKQVIERSAFKEIQMLVKKQKLEKSWLNAEKISVDNKLINGKFEWIVSFKNRDIKDSKKNILYIYLNSYGSALGANYRGE